jgi:acyl-CoA reductase-like NAD-dependent aldehyde dehydrogenase
MCNCLKGVLIKREDYYHFLNKIKKAMNLKKVKFEIFENPSITSKIVQEPEFKSSLWIKSFSRFPQLLKYLDLNKNRLVLHIWSKDEKFIKTVIENTSFARYNLNSDLLSIEFNEPWGGIFWSGNKGPIQWYERFGYIPFIKFKQL